MSRVAIFGCSADPFTVAHREICKMAMERLHIDKLYVIPTVVDYHRFGKDKWLITEEAKVNAIEYMLWSLGPAYLGKWEIDTHELDLKIICILTETEGPPNSGITEEVIGKRRFVHTLLDFRTRLGIDTSTAIILGTDSYNNLTTWHRWAEICAHANCLYVVPGRDGVEPKNKMVEDSIGRSRIDKTTLKIDAPKQDLLLVTASKIREKYRKLPCGMNLYLTDVKRYDNGEATLQSLGWI